MAQPAHLSSDDFSPRETPPRLHLVEGGASSTSPLKTRFLRNENRLYSLYGAVWGEGHQQYLCHLKGLELPNWPSGTVILARDLDEARPMANLLYVAISFVAFGDKSYKYRASIGYGTSEGGLVSTAGLAVELPPEPVYFWRVVQVIWAQKKRSGAWQQRSIQNVGGFSAQPDGSISEAPIEVLPGVDVDDPAMRTEAGNYLRLVRNTCPPERKPFVWVPRTPRLFRAWASAWHLPAENVLLAICPDHGLPGCADDAILIFDRLPVGEFQPLAVYANVYPDGQTMFLGEGALYEGAQVIEFATDGQVTRDDVGASDSMTYRLIGLDSCDFTQLGDYGSTFGLRISRDEGRLRSMPWPTPPTPEAS